MTKLKCILLIDDDSVANSLNEFIIKQMNITECVDIVTDGQEALRYLKDKPAPNLIILDIKMPVLDGFEFLENFGDLEIEGKEDIRIVVLSSSWRDDDKQRALRLGAVEYIVKPISEEKIKEVVSTYFR